MKTYPLKKDPATPNSRDLHLAFDVGHSSIGWAVLQVPATEAPSLLGCGTVIFQADDCLASRRRAFRRQRRHIRSTRQRIARMKTLLSHLGVLSPEALDNVSTSSPWFHAARVLAGKGEEKLTWPLLWDVLRWYAHNRGYDGNKAWSREGQDAAAEKEDTEKVENARSLYDRYKTRTMAETWCAVCGLDPLGTKTSCHLPGDKRPKALNAAFPREDVERETAAILRAHIGHLPHVDEALLTALLSDWHAIPCPEIRLPARYQGGLLFGQLVPRFDNRIIATCPITYERRYQQLLTETGDEKSAKDEALKLSKVPSAACPEFFRYRWALQLANIQIASPTGLRRLSVEERQLLHQQIHARGYFTKGDLKKAVRSLTDGVPDNLDQMLLHPDADKALVLDPIQRLLTSGEFAPVLATLPEPLKKRLRGRLRRGDRLTLGTIREWLGADTAAFDAALETRLSAATTRRSQKTAPISREILLAAEFHVGPPSGRAPHSRALMAEVADFVLSTDRHPAEEGAPLFRSEAIRFAQLQRAIDEQTNNHLVRHRLKILDRLHTDILKEFAQEDTARVGKITMEVNRDVREMSGKSTQEIAKELGQQLANFKSVVKKLEAAFEGKGIKIGPGLIRKARIAEDLGWKCPYTGQDYDAFDLLNRRVDLDHIIPRSLRPSDTLDSLVVTFAEINKMKGKRTAVQFVEEEQGKPVEGLPQLSIKTLAQFQKDVENLESFKGHKDDTRRKKNRKRLLQVRDYVEKEFTPGDLTKTSQLVRLGAQGLQKNYPENPPVITSLPGSVTGAVRKSWRLLGCLGTANPAVTDETTKTEVRNITHLHHALDACVLAFASHFIPRDGGIWELLVKRSLSEPEQARLLAVGTLFQRDAGRKVSLTDLPKNLKEQIRKRLAERRVVQHIPANMSGLQSEETVYRVFDPADSHPSAKRLARWFKEKNIRIPKTEDSTVLITARKRRSGTGTESGKLLHETSTWRWIYQEIEKNKLLGLDPEEDATSKLKPLKAVKILGANFGLALDPEPQVLRSHKIWPQLCTLKKKNGGKWPRVLRNGMLIQISRGNYAGTWKVFSVKNNASGLALDIARPDVIRLQNKTEGHKINVLLSTLLRDGLVSMDPLYSGFVLPQG